MLTLRTIHSNPATAAATDPNFANVTLLLHMDGSNGSTTFTDKSSGNLTSTVSGNAQISTTQSKFGGASGYFDGNGDWITFSSSTAFAFGTGPFTVEFWIWWSGNISGTPWVGVMGSHNGSANWFAVFMNSSGITHYIRTLFPTPVTLASQQWVHFASTRDSSGVCRLFLNGVLQNTGTDTGDVGGSIGWRVGDEFTPGRPPFEGYIDDLRITKGVCRYTANFTIPSSAFPDS